MKGDKKAGTPLIIFTSFFLASCDLGRGKAFDVPLYNFKTAQSMATKITQSNVPIICNFWAELDWHNGIIWRHYDVMLWIK